jgi:hypothetical protein
MCSAKCRVGDAGACLAIAYAVQKDSKDQGEAARLYSRACLLGAARRNSYARYLPELARVAIPMLAASPRPRRRRFIEEASNNTRA